MGTDDWERLVQQAARRYEWRAWSRGISERCLRDRRILDADARHRVDLRLRRLNLDRSAAETMLREGPGLSGPYLPGTVAGEDPVVLERVLGQNELMPISFLQRGARVAESVGRITVRGAGGPNGFGTGFLVGPRLLLTNNHVLADPNIAVRSFVEFNYETLGDGSLDQVMGFEFAPHDLFLTDPDLDFTLLAVEGGDGALEDFGWNRLIAEEGKAIVGERLNIVQHPGGELKQLALRQNQLVDVLDDFLHYRTDTAPGSSGAPVFNDQWEVVALHHAGVPERDAHRRILTRDGHHWRRRMGDHRIKWIANEGARISRIVAAIDAASLTGEADRLRKGMFSSEPPSLPGSRSSEVRRACQDRVSRHAGVDADGVATWQIPLTVSVQVGEPRGMGQAPPAPSSSTPSATVTSCVGLSPSAPLADPNVIVTGQMIRRLLADPAAKAFAKELRDVSGSPAAVERTFGAEFGSDPESVTTFVPEWAKALGALDKASREVDDGILFTTRNRLGALMQSSLAERMAETGAYEVTQRGDVVGRELKFARDDLWGWFKSGFSWVRKSRYHDLLRPATALPDPLPDRARVAVFSDWGTALYGAPHIAESIRRDGAFEVVMHLGDVYYAGTEKEMRRRFLNVWPFGAGHRNRGLNSNHDMYSGGHAYFGLVLPRFDQASSYFAMQNRHWTLVCLDTAYKDFDLDEEQVAWIEEVLQQAGRRRVLFFSHHQLFSQFDEQGRELAKRLKPILEARRVDYWFWGHEHRCVIYKAHEAWGLRGRCVGHGGMPQKRGNLQDGPVIGSAGEHKWRSLPGRRDVPASQVLDGPNVHIRSKEDTYLPHGYVTLEFDGEELHEVYMSAVGEELLRLPPPTSPNP